MRTFWDFLTVASLRRCTAMPTPRTTTGARLQPLISSGRDPRAFQIIQSSDDPFVFPIQQRADQRRTSASTHLNCIAAAGMSVLSAASPRQPRVYLEERIPAWLAAADQPVIAAMGT